MKKCRCQKQTRSSTDTTFHLIWCNLRSRHYCIVLQIMHVTELLLNTWMSQAGMDAALLHCNLCCCWPSLQEGCTPVVKWRVSPTSYSAQSLTQIQYFELRVTETLVPQAQTASLATKRKTPNLQARSHRLFIPEHPSHKHLINSAFFSIMTHFLHHCSFLTYCKAPPDVLFLRHWSAGLWTSCNGQKPG